MNYGTSPSLGNLGSYLGNVLFSHSTCFLTLKLSQVLLKGWGKSGQSLTDTKPIPWSALDTITGITVWWSRGFDCGPTPLLYSLEPPCQDSPDLHLPGTSHQTSAIRTAEAALGGINNPNVVGLLGHWPMDAAGTLTEP